MMQRYRIHVPVYSTINFHNVMAKQRELRKAITDNLYISDQSLLYHGATYHTEYAMLRWEVVCTEKQLTMILLMTAGTLVDYH